MLTCIVGGVGPEGCLHDTQPRELQLESLGVTESEFVPRDTQAAVAHFSEIMGDDRRDLFILKAERQFAVPGRHGDRTYP